MKHSNENEAWQSMASDLASDCSSKHIWREKMTRNHNWREWGHIERNPIPNWQDHIKFYWFFICDMTTLKMALFSQLWYKFICIKNIKILNVDDRWAGNVEKAII